MCNFRSWTITIITPLMKAYKRSMLARCYTANIGLWSVLFHNFIARGLKLNWNFFPLINTNSCWGEAKATRWQHFEAAYMGSCAWVFSYLHICDYRLFLHLRCMVICMLVQKHVESYFLPLQTGLWSLQAAKTSATLWQLMVLLPWRT